MAILNLSVTIPNAQISRVQTAVRAAFGQVPDGTGGMRDMTDEELVEKLRQDVIQTIKGMVIQHERSAAIAAAEKLEPVVDAT